MGNFGGRKKNKKKQAQKKPRVRKPKTRDEDHGYPGPLQETVTCREVAIYVPPKESPTSRNRRYHDSRHCDCQDHRKNSRTYYDDSDDYEDDDDDDDAYFMGAFLDYLMRQMFIAGLSRSRTYGNGSSRDRTYHNGNRDRGDRSGNIYFMNGSGDVLMS